MSTITEIVAAAQRLRPEEFVQLRTALDQVEEELWIRESAKVSSKHRQEKLADAKIDALVIKRRYQGRKS